MQWGGLWDRVLNLLMWQKTRIHTQTLAQKHTKFWPELVVLWQHTHIIHMNTQSFFFSVLHWLAALWRTIRPAFSLCACALYVCVCHWVRSQKAAVIGLKQRDPQSVCQPISILESSPLNFSNKNRTLSHGQRLFFTHMFDILSTATGLTKP